jgi:hypothetical protein
MGRRIAVLADVITVTVLGGMTWSVGLVQIHCSSRFHVHDIRLRKNNCDNLSKSESCIDLPSSFELAVETRQAKSDKTLN